MDMLLDVSRNDPNFTIDDIREETETFLFAVRRWLYFEKCGIWLGIVFLGP